MPAELGSVPFKTENGKPLILFVDDNDALRDIITDVLESRCGYSVVTADGGKSCLYTLKDIHPDMILLDIMMEPMDGWDTLREIRNVPEYRNIPVVLMTGKIFLPQEMIAYGPYICGWIRKPIRMEPFAELVQQIFSELAEDMEVAEERGGSLSPEEKQKIILHRRRHRVLSQLYQGILDQCITPEKNVCSAWHEDTEMMQDLIAREEERCRELGVL